MAEGAEPNGSAPRPRRAVWALLAASGVLGASGVAGVLTYLWPRRVRGVFRVVDAGPVAAYADGDAAFGPAGRPLDTLPLRIEAGRVRVMVGPGRAQRRELGAPPPVMPVT